MNSYREMVIFDDASVRADPSDHLGIRYSAAPVWKTRSIMAWSTR